MNDAEKRQLVQELLKETQLQSYHAIFLEDISKKLNSDRPSAFNLTFKQTRYLLKLENYYSEHEKQKRKDWAVLYQTKKKDFLVVAGYYSQTEYYREPARRALEDDTFVPTQRVYQNMVHNRYAEKVLREHYSTPKYKVGELVYPVKSYTPIQRTWQGPFSRGGIVLRTDAAPISSACKGSKKYLILPVGKAHALVLEERWLKRKK